MAKSAAFIREFFMAEEDPLPVNVDDFDADVAEVALLPVPSDEQSRIIQDTINGDDVIVDAVAGSGKTTTVLHVAQANPGKRILMITYNKTMKEEVRRKAVECELPNLIVHNYHSMGYHYYSSIAKNDMGLHTIVSGSYRPIRTLRFDMLIVDECQDMTPMYYSFIRKVVDDMLEGDAFQLMLLGDNFQCINEYKGADARFMLRANDLWCCPMTRRTLSTSYRLTTPMAYFVNEYCLGATRLHAVKHGVPVKFLRYEDIYRGLPEVARMVQDLLISNRAKPEDIFILAASVTQRNMASISPVRKLANQLSDEMGFNVFDAQSDEAIITPAMLAGKIAVCSFHQSKGRERKYVFVIGFDKAYNKYFHKTDPERLSPAMYVALTRATHELVVVGGPGLLQFEKPELIGTDVFKANVHLSTTLQLCHDKSVELPGTPVTVPYHWSVTQMLRNIPLSVELVLSAIIPMCFRQIHPPGDEIPIPHESESIDGRIEPVADLAAEAICCIFQHKGMSQKSAAEQHVTYITMGKSPPAGSGSFKNTSFFREASASSLCRNYELPRRAAPPRIPMEEYTLSDYLQLCNYYLAIKSWSFARAVQLRSFDFLSWEQVNACIRRIQAVADDITPSSETMFECCVKFSEDVTQLHPIFGCLGESSSVSIEGYIDIVTPRTIWELKCTQTLTTAHFLQLVVYAYLWKNRRDAAPDNRDFKLFNMRSGELWVMDTSKFHLVEDMMRIIVEHSRKRTEYSDAAFIRKYARE